MGFIWMIRSWSSIESFWEHVREHKEYDKAYSSTNDLLSAIEKTIVKEQNEWNELFNPSEREFSIELPTIEKLKGRPFFKFLTVTSGQDAKDVYMKCWYVERLTIA